MRNKGIPYSLQLFSESETKEAGYNFASLLIPGDAVFLIGDLGTGKTTFVKGVASYFGIEEEIVSSPTFTYLHLYDQLAHFDLYRLGNREQFFSMGFDEYLSPPFITFIEWPQIIERGLKSLMQGYKVILEYKGEGRKVEISKM